MLIKVQQNCILGKTYKVLFFFFFFFPLLPQGCWRKITIDDTMPFDEEDNLLLPATTSQIELWPMLLSKAIIKLANTRYVQSVQSVQSVQFTFSLFCEVTWNLKRELFQYMWKMYFTKSSVMRNIRFYECWCSKSVKQESLWIRKVEFFLFKRVCVFMHLKLLGKKKSYLSICFISFPLFPKASHVVFCQMAISKTF